MGITRGFGVIIDFDNGTSRQWVMGVDGVKRWSDSGEPLSQEFFNSMMRYPWESKITCADQPSKCPICEERYCGDGKQPCLECSASKRIGEVDE